MTVVSTLEAVKTDDVERETVAPSRSRKFDLNAISQFSDEDIRGSMSTSELIQVIRSVEYPFAGKERLEYFDRDTLERVVCLVRRWSCRQLGKPTL